MAVKIFSGFYAVVDSLSRFIDNEGIPHENILHAAIFFKEEYAQRFMLKLKPRRYLTYKVVRVDAKYEYET